MSSNENSETLNQQWWQELGYSMSRWSGRPTVLAKILESFDPEKAKKECQWPSVLSAFTSLSDVSSAVVWGQLNQGWSLIHQSGEDVAVDSQKAMEFFDQEQEGWASGEKLAPAQQQSQPNSLWIYFPIRSAVQRNASSEVFWCFLFLPNGFSIEYGVSESEFVAQVSFAGRLLWNWASERKFQGDRLRNAVHLLEMITRWNRSRDTIHLLHEMAHSATEWFRCERATVFLWNKSTKKLVGRPAVGVDGGQLVIPETAGLVGQVVQSRQVGRVDRGVDSQQKQIDRSTDNQLGFVTKNLLCAPLLSCEGECLGAFELINKVDSDFTDADEANLVHLSEHASVAIQNVREKEELLADHKVLQEQASAEVKLKGESLPIKQVRQTIQRVAQTDLSVLILGENGTGKEVAAQMVHYLSDRKDEVVIAINCAAMPDNLLESELFGHEKGAFTDASNVRKGKFELASRGTIFLDEIGDMSLSGQAKLLRVLEEKSVVRVGGSVSIPTDARIVAATNQNLMQLVQEKRFREDLFFRLNVVTLEMPALRHRGDDILLLADYFLETFSAKARKQKPSISKNVAERMLAYHWPGNVRELRNTMERFVYMGSGGAFQFAPPNTIPGSEAVSPVSFLDTSQSLADATVQFQTDYIRQGIQDCDGNMTEAAKRMGVHRTNLYRKMKQLGMELDD